MAPVDNMITAEDLRLKLAELQGWVIRPAQGDQPILELPRGEAAQQAVIAEFAKALNKDIGDKERADPKKEVVIPPGKDAKLAAGLKGCLHKKDVDSRGNVFQKMKRLMSEEEKKDYAAKSTEEKADWRLDWTAKHLRKIEAKYDKVESWEVEDIEFGEYLPLPVIVQREGGWEMAENIEAAIHYVTRCSTMRGRWVYFNPMTNRAEYLYLRKQYKSTFSEKWTKYLELQENPEKAEEKEKEKEQEKERAAQAARTPASKRARGSGGTPAASSKKAKGEGSKANTGDGEVDEANPKKLVAKAFKTKVQHVSVLSAANTLLKQINAAEVEAPYGWAKNNKFTQTLRDEVYALESKCNDDFSMKILCAASPAALLSEYKGNEIELVTKLSVWNKQGDSIESIQKLTKRLHSMEAAASV